MKFLLLPLVFLFSSLSVAEGSGKWVLIDRQSCELSKAYLKATSEVRKLTEYAHSTCHRSVSEFHYWKLVAKCESEKRGEGIGGGCQHVAGYVGSSEPMTDYEHCNILEVDKSQYEAALADYIEFNNIVKCSNLAKKGDS